MLKKLFLIWIFSGSLDSFSQDSTKQSKNIWVSNLKVEIMDLYPKPDTLRAIILVTLSPNGIAHARMGYVVIAEGKEVEYLDCRKKALKLPQVGWGYRVVNPNNQK